MNEINTGSKFDVLQNAIQGIPDQYAAIKNRLLICLLSSDLQSIHIYTVGLIDMGNVTGGPVDLMATLNAVRKVME